MTFETRLSERYDTLSSALRQAGDYMVRNPVDAASRTLRSVAQDSGLSPAAFSRLARALGYDDYEELREEMRARIGDRVNSFAERAERLQLDHQKDRASFFEAHLAACQSNLAEFGAGVDAAALDAAVERLTKARKVVLHGALGSTGVVEYLSYMASFCAANWSMASRMGASLGAGLTGLDERDALIVVTKPPFSDRAIKSAALARKKGIYVVLITDTHKCPALKYASCSFIVPTASPHFYSSYVVTMFLVEALIGVFASHAGPTARRRIAEVESANRILAEVWDQ